MRFSESGSRRHYKVGAVRQGGVQAGPHGAAHDEVVHQGKRRFGVLGGDLHRVAFPEAFALVHVAITEYGFLGEFGLELERLAGYEALRRGVLCRLSLLRFGISKVRPLALPSCFDISAMS